MKANRLPSLPQEDVLADLPAFLSQQRWFGGKARGIRSVEIMDVVPMADDRVSADLVLASVQYADQYRDETYAVPLLTPIPSETSSDQSAVGARPSGFARGVPLRDALLNADFLTLLLKAVDRERIYAGGCGRIRATATRAYRQAGRKSPEELRPSLLKAEQSNSSILYDDRFILKLLRQVDEGINPELEMGRFLTERASFSQVPALAGSIVYEGNGAAPRTLGILQAFVQNQGSAWDYTLQALDEYLTRMLRSDAAELIRPGADPPTTSEEALFGRYFQSAELLGRRTAELHIALASDPDDPDFAPEPLSKPYQDTLQNSMLEECHRVFDLLRARSNALPDAVHERAEKLLSLQGAVQERLRCFGEMVSDGSRIRVHGDYHLGQVLWSNDDFVIIDFEGEPARLLSERRVKHSPLLDVAGMLRSFHYAASKGFQDWAACKAANLEIASRWQDRIRMWKQSVCSHFLSAYIHRAKHASFLPSSSTTTAALLDVYLLNKATYELGYEMNNRPDWVSIPLEAILEILGD